MKRTAAVTGRLFVLLWAPLAILPGETATAAENAGITVSGTGVAKAMPDVVELTAPVVGTAELAGDAVEKYRGNKRRVVEALNALNIKGMTISGSGLSVNSGAQANPLAALQGGQANQAQVADKVSVQEDLTITLPGVDTMSADDVLKAVTSIVDVAKDAGVSMGASPKSLIEIQLRSAKPSALATFKLGDPDALRQQAYEAALKQARAKAERLAQLAGAELGDIVSIREAASVAKDDDNGGGFAAYMALFGGASGGQPEFTSASFESIPVTVSLSVQFEIAKQR